MRAPVIVRYIQILVLLFGGLSSAMPVLAQGWQWGRANTAATVDGWAVATDKYGNVFCAGERSGVTDAIFGTYTVPYTGGVANFQCVIVKYDANGNFQWASGNSSGNANLTGIATDPSGNVYMFGSFGGTIKIGAATLINTKTNGDYEYFLAKFDPLGNVLWAIAAGNAQSAVIVNINGLTATGGTVGLGGIATDASGNVYITANFHEKAITIGGYTLANADPSGLTDDIFLVKYDPMGNVAWAKSAGGTLSDDAYAITVTPAGDIYLAGDFASPSVTFGPSVITNTAGAAYQTAFIARFDASGNPVWASASGGAGNEYAAGLTSDIAGNVYMVGGLNDNSISFNGTAIANPFTGQYAAYLVKFDPGNNVSWYKTIGSPIGGDVWGVSVAVSRCGYVWISGGMPLSLTVAGDTVPGQVSIDGRIFTTPAGSTTDPIFVAGYTTGGNFADGEVLQSGADDQDGLACDPSGNVFLCGDYVGTSPVNIGGISFPADATPQRELMYVTKYTPPFSNQDNFVHLDTSICFISGMLLSATPGYATYLWSDGRTSATRNVTDTGVIWVRGDDTCGIYVIDTFRVNNLCNCGKYLFVPNSFTPNGDGQNDVFYPRSSHGETQIKSFRIYNRWGELLFERDNIYANDASNAWDGSYKGNLPLPDVYVYMVDAICEDGTAVHKKGSVTVIR